MIPEYIPYHPRLSLVVNVAPFGNRKGAAARQDHALNTLEALRPSWCDLTDAAVLHDAPDFDPGAIPQFWLERDAADGIEGALHLPYIRELMLISTHQTATWIGFINNDNIVTPRFFEHFEETDKECLMVRVSDIKALPTPGGGPWGPIKRQNPYSLDGLFVRGEARQVFWDTYPDFILGDAWDPATVQWAGRHLGPRAGFIDDDAVLHLVHGGSPARGAITSSQLINEPTGISMTTAGGYVPTVVGKYNQDLAKAAK